MCQLTRGASPALSPPVALPFSIFYFDVTSGPELFNPPLSVGPVFPNADDLISPLQPTTHVNIKSLSRIQPCGRDQHTGKMHFYASGGLQTYVLIIINI